MNEIIFAYLCGMLSGAGLAFGLVELRMIKYRRAQRQKAHDEWREKIWKKNPD